MYPFPQATGPSSDNGCRQVQQKTSFHMDRSGLYARLHAGWQPWRHPAL